MSDLAVLTNQVSMTSKDIADLVGSRHSDVIRSIERLMDKGVITYTPIAFSEKINNLGLPAQRNGYNSISVAVYPYNAWLDVYEVDLDLLFKD